MDILHMVFELLEMACLAEGGDGDTALICDDYHTAANDFQKWLNDGKGYHKDWKRHDGDGCVAFSSDPESNIHFSNTETTWHTMTIKYNLNLWK